MRGEPSQERALAVARDSARLGLEKKSARGLVVLAGLALTGWFLDVRELATLWPEAIPMAPSTALAFLGTAYVLGARPSGRGAAGRSWGALAVLLCLLLVALLALLPSGPLEAQLRAKLAGGGEFRGFPIGVMSTATASIFLLDVFALGALWFGPQRGARRTAALAGVATATAGLMVVLGYVFRAPLFELSHSVIPVAPSTGMGFVMAGTGALAAAGSDVWPTSAFSGAGIRQQLGRAFFPATAAVVLLVAWAMAWIVSGVKGNPAIAASALVGISLLVVGWVTSRLAQTIGAELESSRRERAAARAGEAQARAEAASILACAGEGICGVDEQGVITFLNPAGAALFSGNQVSGGHVSSDQELDFRGLHHATLFHAGGRSGENAGQVDGNGRSAHCPICATLESGQREEVAETSVRRPDGSLLEVRLLSSPILEADRVSGVVASFADLTAHKLLEQQLRQSQKMEAIGRLAGGVAHDFNNLLAVILSYSELIRKTADLQPRHREDLGEIVRASHRAAQLTGQLLAFSRQQVLQTKVVDLGALIRDVEKMLGRLIGEDVDLAVSVGDRLGRVRVDPGQVEQILVNLVVNSRDALPLGGRITLEAANVELDAAYAAGHLDTEPGRYVMLAVSDNGVGMDAETKARIFEPFFTTKELGRGTGLGLSTVFGIVKQSRGHIWVYSEPGRGTTFKVYFPEVEAQPATTSEASEAATGGNETLLLVEDEEALRKAMVRVLEAAGYTVLVASDGAAALELPDCDQVDLVVTDVVMPGIGGPELVERLRQRVPQIRALYTSGYTDRGVVREALLEEGMTFLQKPFTPGSLMKKVREALGVPSAR